MTELTHPDDGCFFHGREPIPPGCYRVCGECGHAYATPEDLLAAEGEALAQINAADLENPEPLVPSERADDIAFCPLCTHDW